jgi:hypothetical protein
MDYESEINQEISSFDNKVNEKIESARKRNEPEYVAPTSSRSTQSYKKVAKPTTPTTHSEESKRGKNTQKDIMYDIDTVDTPEDEEQFRGNEHEDDHSMKASKRGNIDNTETNVVNTRTSSRQTHHQRPDSQLSNRPTSVQSESKRRSRVGESDF